jgi:hypothetical protein
MAKDKDEVVVYWGPPYRTGSDHMIDWNMFYTDPEELLPDFKKDRIKEIRQNSIAYCPAFNDNYKNTFIVRNVVDSKFTWNDQEKKWEIPTKYQVHPALDVRMPYMNNRMAIITSLVWLFVCEESLEMEIIPPYMHQTEASKYGVITSGKFDIGSWYRPILAEYLLWEGVDRLQLKENEPLFYIRFNTDKKVVLKRFANTEEIYKHTVSIVQTKYIFGKLPALDKLYNYFARTQTKDIMLKKIKDAVIDK